MMSGPVPKVSHDQKSHVASHFDELDPGNDTFSGVYSVLGLIELSYCEVNVLGSVGSKNRRLRLQ